MHSGHFILGMTLSIIQPKVFQTAILKLLNRSLFSRLPPAGERVRKVLSCLSLKLVFVHRYQIWACNYPSIETGKSFFRLLTPTRIYCTHEVRISFL